jgi:hypothetical protein
MTLMYAHNCTSDSESRKGRHRFFGGSSKTPTADHKLTLVLMRQDLFQRASRSEYFLLNHHRLGRGGNGETLSRDGDDDAQLAWQGVHTLWLGR